MSLRKSGLRMPVSEYLELEKTSEVKHEYLDGEIYAMSGASKRHNLIGNNLNRNLDPHLRGGPCQVFTFEVKVYIEALNTFYYPDLVVACDPEDSDEYFVKRPVLVVEVESPTTSTIDRREKLMAYRRLPSLREYVILSQDRVSADVFRRDKEGSWLSEQIGTGETLRIESVGITIPLNSLYEGIELTTQ
jgi:Uma2 family endonuclease